MFNIWLIQGYYIDMVKKSNTWDKIDANKKFRKGECIKNKHDSNCYIVYKVNANGLDLLNIHDGSFNLNVVMKDIIADYVMVTINPIVYYTLLFDYPKSALDEIVADYALQVCINTIEKKNNKIIGINDYPSVVVSAKPKYNASYKEITNDIVVSHNQNWSETSWHRKFVGRLDNIKYSLGAKIKQCKNTIGNCAEQHAANNLLILNQNVDIDSIDYSKAIRPRTGEIILYCENCQKILKLKN